MGFNGGEVKDLPSLGRHVTPSTCNDPEKGPPCYQWDFQGPPTMGPPYGKLPILFPKDMGMVWEAYHKGLLGIPGITLDCQDLIISLLEGSTTPFAFTLILMDFVGN